MSSNCCRRLEPKNNWPRTAALPASSKTHVAVTRTNPTCPGTERMPSERPVNLDAAVSCGSHHELGAVQRERFQMYRVNQSVFICDQRAQSPNLLNILALADFPGC